MARSTHSPANHPHPPSLPSKLPLRSINHITYAVPQPSTTASFFETVLGFKRLPRPDSFNVDGAWICGMGVEIHFILQPSNSYPRSSRTTCTSDEPLNPCADHLSFLCPYSKDSQNDWNLVLKTLRGAGIQLLERHFEERDLHQVMLIRLPILRI
eukprot:GFKZ01002632.1.p1 GENE.GFKZ01002632.1~~GFKZ01002632.1.p1  ORF type:complete len:155 (-),score=3.24 GFKZ01002632.1:547-1011(-)